VLVLVLVPIIVGVLGYYLPRTIATALMLIGQGFLLAWAWQLFQTARSAGPFYEGLGGDRPLYIAFRGEQTALALVLLTVVLSTAALIYTLNEDYFSTRLMLLILILQGLSIGILLTDDIFNLFVLIEVSTLVGVLLTMYRPGLRSAYDGLYYMSVQVIAMMFFLFGVAYLYQIFGVLSVSDMTAAVGAVPARALLLPVAFILTGIAVKVGFFPLFSYIPHAYGNPGAPVAALAMLSAVVVSGSVFWLARLITTFAPLASLEPFIAIAATLTVIAGAIKALGALDIRVFLAYSTVSQMGLIALGLVAGGVSRDGALFHIATHAVAKALLFFAAGVLLDSYGTARINQIRGAFRRCPIAAVAIILSLLSLAGLPFTAGGASKYWLAYDVANPWLSAAIWLSTALTVLISLRFAMTLIGPSVATLPAGRWRGGKDAVVLALTLALLAIGIFGNQLISGVVPFQGEIALASAMEKGLITLAIAAAMVPVLRLLLREPQTRQGETMRRLAYRITRDGALSLPDAVLVMTGFFFAALATGLFLGVGRG